MVAAGGEGGGLAFVDGERLLSKRNVLLKREDSSGQAELLNGWHSAEVVKAWNAGTIPRVVSHSGGSRPVA